jgi:L-lactate transport
MMHSAFALIWSQPLDPLFHSLGLSALVAAIPLVVVLVLMGGLLKSGLLASAWGLVTAGLLATLVWGMPVSLAFWSVLFGFAYAVWFILWIVFNGLWLYKLALDTGSFELLRRWMAQNASNDACIQAVLVAFCFGALLEGSAGFGAPVAITAFMLVQLGFEARRAVVVSLIANTAPVAFGGSGNPILALAGVTELDILKLSAMVGRQLPFLSLMLPAYLIWVVGGGKGLRRTWPAALVVGSSFAAAQFLVSNYWGPYATDVVAALASVMALVAFLRVWKPGDTSNGNELRRAGVLEDAAQTRVSAGATLAAWLPWALLSLVMILWSYLKLFRKGEIDFPVPILHNSVRITLYQKPYQALYHFDPLAVGTAVLVTTALTALCLRARPRTVVESGTKALRQLRLPGLTVLLIVGLSYLYNYSGMTYTLGAAMAQVGPVFPLISSYLGWVACFLTGSDTASNLLFGNLQVVAAHKLNLSPILLAATNSSGAVAGKMISPQNIAVGVMTVGLIGQEGKVLRSTFWHSMLLATLIGLLAWAQAYLLGWMVPPAENGDAQSQYEVGKALDKDPSGMAKDQVEAVRWYRKAAEQNYAQAQNNLGVCYVNGQSVAKDEVEAAKWFRKAAEQNNADAQNNLGACYVTGHGVVKEKPVLCLAHVTNCMAKGEGDFGKGEADGNVAILSLLERIATKWKNSGSQLLLRPESHSGPLPL